MKYAICAAILILASTPLAAQSVNLMDTSGGAAIPSPAISVVPGYPRPSDPAAAQTTAKRVHTAARARRRLAHIALQPVSPAVLPD